MTEPGKISFVSTNTGIAAPLGELSFNEPPSNISFYITGEELFTLHAGGDVTKGEGWTTTDQAAESLFVCLKEVGHRLYTKELQTVYDVNAELVIRLENISSQYGMEDAYVLAVEALAYAKEHTPT